MTTDAAGPYQTILAAIDGSDHRHRLLAAVADLALLAGSSVDVLHVDADSPAFDTAAGSESEDSSTGVVSAAVDALRWRGVDANGLVAHAADPDIDDAILATAHARGTTLIVLGPKHRRGLGAWLEASVTDEVAHQTSVPVLLVP
jgi:nucleotide-binding universal stress UspA family protein